MELSHAPEYEAFRATLRAFLAANRERAPRGGMVASAGTRGSRRRSRGRSC